MNGNGAERVARAGARIAAVVGLGVALAAGVASGASAAVSVTTAGGGECLSARGEAVRFAIDSLPTEGGRVSWGEPWQKTWEPEGACPNLMFAVVSSGPASDDPDHVLLFGHDRYLGTATPASHAVSEVVSWSSESIVVRYGTYVADEPRCCPAGAEYVVFTLGADDVVTSVGTPPAY